MEVYNIYPEKEFDDDKVESWIKTVVECLKANNKFLKDNNKV